MSPVLLLIVFGFLYLDSFVIRRQDPALYKKYFQTLTWPVAVYGFLLLIAFVFSQQWAQLSTYCFFFVLPVYLVKRYGFTRHLPGERKDPEVLGLRLSLSVDLLGSILIWSVWMSLFTLGLKILYSLYPPLQSELGEVVVISAASPLVLLWIIRRSVHKYTSISFLEILGLKRHNLSWWKLTVVPFLAGACMAGISSWIIYSRETQPATPLSQLAESTTAMWVFPALMIVAVFMAPFLEEILFRGYFYYILEKIKGKKAAIIIIPCLFALLHVEQYWGDWLAILVVAVLGLILTLQRMRTGSAIPGIIMHYVYNGGMTFISIVIFAMSNPTYFEFQQQYHELDFKGKETLLLKSINHQPSSPGPYNDLAWIYAENDIHLPRALELINKALTLDPDNFAFLDTKAEVLYKMGRIQEAIDIEEGLVREYPDNVYSRQQLDKFKSDLKE